MKICNRSRSPKSPWTAGCPHKHIMRVGASTLDLCCQHLDISASVYGNRSLLVAKRHYALHTTDRHIRHFHRILPPINSFDRGVKTTGAVLNPSFAPTASPSADRTAPWQEICPLVHWIGHHDVALYILLSTMPSCVHRVGHHDARSI